MWARRARQGMCGGDDMMLRKVESEYRVLILHSCKGLLLVGRGRRARSARDGMYM